ncbi:MAG: PsbP-related protein [bacterium]|nr:PsbP-related protein [bacterium]
MDKKIKYLIIFVVIILIVGVGGFLAWQQGWIPTLKSFSKLTSDETTDWKIYKNEEYGFEFKYPSFWNIGESNALSADNPNQDRNFIQINLSNNIYQGDSEAFDPCPSGRANIVYQIGKLRMDAEGSMDTERTFEEFVNFQIENPERGPYIPRTLIPVTIDGHNALMFNQEIRKDETSKICKGGFYYIDQGLNHYTTVSFIVDKQDDKLIIDQILSTFKFTR